MCQPHFDKKNDQAQKGFEAGTPYRQIRSQRNKTALAQWIADQMADVGDQMTDTMDVGIWKGEGGNVLIRIA